MIRLFDRTRRLRLLLALLLTASIVFITIDFRTAGEGPLEKAGRTAMSVLGPLQEGIARVLRPVGNFFAGFTQVGSLKEQIQELERQNALLKQREQQVADVGRENDRLRRLLGLEGRLGLKTVPAQVIGVGPSNFEHTIIVDRGSAEGIRKDMPVVAGDGLVGRVVTVGPHTARVLLLIDRSNAVAGRLAANGETGVLEGTGREELRFELLDAAAPVRLGDQVVTSGYEGGVYPPGVPIGSVSRLAPRTTALTRLVFVQPFVDFTSLDYLLIVVGRDERVRREGKR